MTGTLALAVRRLGTLDYQAAWQEQRRLHAAVVAGTAPDTVLLLEHPSVYTAGKRTQPWERPADGSPVVETDRGGQITWHGPGQLVGYPIVRLPTPGGRPRDVVAYVRRMEQLLIDACGELGLATTRVKGRTGVWVPAASGRSASGARDQAAGPGSAAASGRSASGARDQAAGPGSAADRRGPERKVASIGVRVARGVAMHGFALNCDCDLSAFDRIVACGIRDARATSLSAELGRPVPVAEVLPVVERHLATLLD